MTFADSSCINYMKCLTFTTAGYYFLLKTIHHLIQIHIAKRSFTKQKMKIELIFNPIIFSLSSSEKNVSFCIKAICLFFKFSFRHSLSILCFFCPLSS